MLIVYLIGIDGAGKSTLGKRLAADLSGHYIYCGTAKGLRRRLRLLSQKLFLKNTHPVRSYPQYQRMKREARKKHPRLTGLYALSQYVILFFRSWTRFGLAWLRGGVAIADRYSCDVAVTTATLMDYSMERMLRHSKILERILPRPVMTLFLAVDEQTALARKKDIPSLEYLTDRIAKYQALSRQHSWITLDARQPADVVYSQAVHLITEKLQART